MVTPITATQNPPFKKYCSVCAALKKRIIPRRYLLIHDFEHCTAVLSSNQYYKGYCEVWLKPHKVELFELSDVELFSFFSAIKIISSCINSAFRPMKLNYEILGNTVQHMHCHIIPRYPDDPNPKRPIWENDLFLQQQNTYGMTMKEKQCTASRISEKLANFGVTNDA